MADPRSALVGRAAADNAALCDAVCRSHGLAGEQDAEAWTSPVRTPPRYPDAVTLVPVLDLDRLLGRIDDRPGCSIKDSFASLDLARRPGWSVLFEATWVAHPPPSPVAADATQDEDAHEADEPAVGWDPVVDPAALLEWAQARGADEPDGLWRADLLRQDVVVLAGRRGTDVVGGAVLVGHDDVVGVSNVFAAEPTVDVWHACLSWVSRHLAGRPVVGYESGVDLTAALDHGFEPIGPLRIWVRSAD